LLVLISTLYALEPEDLVGTWEVKMTANYSTCGPPAASVGDIFAQQWVFSVSSGSLVVEVLGAGTTNAR